MFAVVKSLSLENILLTSGHAPILSAHDRRRSQTSCLQAHFILYNMETEYTRLTSLSVQN